MTYNVPLVRALSGVIDRDAYLEACAASGGKPPDGQALEALLPWNICLPPDPGRPP
jgi:hypothetical protein